jgi:hypothetical protein
MSLWDYFLSAILGVRTYKEDHSTFNDKSRRYVKLDDGRVLGIRRDETSESVSDEALVKEYTDLCSKFERGGALRRRKITEADQESLFKVLRDYIKHEDTLIVSRTTWYIGLNSFLFATYGFVVSSMIKSVLEHSSDAGQIASSITAGKIGVAAITTALALVGLFSSVTTAISVRAANNSIRALRLFWEQNGESRLQKFEIYTKNGLPVMTHHDFPYIVGGGPGFRTAGRGRTTSKVLPILMCTMWIVLMVSPIAMLSAIPNNRSEPNADQPGKLEPDQASMP